MWILIVYILGVFVTAGIISGIEAANGRELDAHDTTPAAIIFWPVALVVVIVHLITVKITKMCKE